MTAIARSRETGTQRRRSMRMLAMIGWLLASCESAVDPCAPDDDVGAREDAAPVDDATTEPSGDVLIDREEIDLGSICTGLDVHEELVLANVGAERIATSVRVIGADASSFTAEPECDGLAPGELCTVVVRASLTELRAVSASLELTLGTRRVELPLRAALVVCEREPIVAPTPHDFGEVSVGSRGEAVVFTARFGGDGVAPPFTAVEITGLDADQFAVARDGCSGHALASVGRCPVEVRFSPTREGLASASLVIRTASASGAATLQGRAIP